MSYLSKEKIISFMEKPLDERLIITPLLDKEEQINDGAVDVRLGTQFIIIKRTAFLGLDPRDRDEIRKNIRNY